MPYKRSTFLSRMVAAGSLILSTSLFAQSPTCDTFTSSTTYASSFPSTGTHYTRVTGSTDATIFGHGIYTIDSNIAVAAVHSSNIHPGQDAILQITMEGEVSSFTSLNNYGITSIGWTIATDAYSISLVEDCTPATVALTGLTASASSVDPAYPLQNLFDGLLSTDWRTSTGNNAAVGLAPYVDVHLPAPNRINLVTVARAATTHDIEEGTVTLYDAFDTVLYTSELLSFESAIPYHLYMDVAEVSRIRVLSSQDESLNPGLAEIAVYANLDTPASAQPTIPAADPVPTLALVSGVSASSTTSEAAGNPASSAFDGDLTTNWFTATGVAANLGASAFIEAELSAPKTIRQVKFYAPGGTESDYRPHGGHLTFYDSSGQEIADSVEQVIFPMASDEGATIDVNVSGVAKVRFDSASDALNAIGFAEMELFAPLQDNDGDGIDDAVDPDDDNDGMPDDWESLYPGLDPLVADASGNPDGDPSDNFREYETGTDPTSNISFIAPDIVVPVALPDMMTFLLTPADTDGDGTSDADEMALPGRNPALPDAPPPPLDRDNDGIPDETDPDDDNDGMTDEWENQYLTLADGSAGLDPLVDDGDGNLDGDAATNLREFETGTDPTSNVSFIAPDIIVLIHSGSLSTFVPAPADTDGDGISDAQEMEEGTDPSVAEIVPPPPEPEPPCVHGSPDSDGDGMPDCWEEANGFDKDDPADAYEHADSDNYNNLYEFLSGTDPRDGESFHDIAAAPDKLIPIRMNGIVIFIPVPADTDLDGMSDVWEIEHGFHPAHHADALLDADDDGYTNLEEFKNRTDPHVPYVADRLDETADTDNDGEVNSADPLPFGALELSMQEKLLEPTGTLIVSAPVEIDSGKVNGELYTGITAIEGIEGSIELSVNDGPFRSVPLINTDTLSGPPVKGGDILRARLRSSSLPSTESRVLISVGDREGGTGANNSFDFEWVVKTSPTDRALDDDDHDGYLNYLDEFPEDGEEWEDLDGDGYGDHEKDAFPGNPDEWADSDSDGVGDNSDAFPNDEDYHADANENGEPDSNEIMDIVSRVSGVELVTAIVEQAGSTVITCEVLEIYVHPSTGVNYVFGNIPAAVTHVTFSFTRGIGENLQFQELGGSISNFNAQSNGVKSINFSSNDVFPDIELGLGPHQLKSTYRDANGDSLGEFILTVNIEPIMSLAAKLTGTEAHGPSSVFKHNTSVSLETRVQDVPPGHTISNPIIRFSRVGWVNDADGQPIFRDDLTPNDDDQNILDQSVPLTTGLVQNREYAFHEIRGSAEPGIYRGLAEVTITAPGLHETYTTPTIEVVITPTYSAEITDSPIPEAPIVTVEDNFYFDTGEPGEITWTVSQDELHPTSYCNAGGVGSILDQRLEIPAICGQTSFPVEIECVGPGGKTKKITQVHVTGVLQCAAGVQPLVPSLLEILDTDGDGISDVEENRIGTNPLLKDSDGDGFDDNVEIAAGSSPLDNSSRPDDVSPLAFAFTPEFNVVPGERVRSNIVTIGSIHGDLPLVLEADAGDAKVRIEGVDEVSWGPWVTAANVRQGDKIQLEMTASSANQVKRIARVKVGSHTALWGVTTHSSSLVAQSAEVEPAESAEFLISDAVGASEGAFSVNQSGAATYSMPLFTPAGTGGVAPPLSIGYNSQGGNGILGKGWSLSGLSAISRCRQTEEVDGQSVAVTLTDTDRFCLDGARLIRVDATATYGGDGVEYRTEINSQTKVTSRGSLNGGPLYFEVRRKDGSLSEYGNTEDSRFRGEEAAETTLSWARNKFQDSTLVPILYTYERDSVTKESNLRHIDYAFGSLSAAPSNAGARITLNYLDMDRLDSSRSLLRTAEIVRTRLLENIEVLNRASGNLVPVRTYNFEYVSDTSRKDNISLLHSIEECASDASDSVCKSPTVFEWSKNTAIGFAHPAPNSIGVSDFVEGQPADVDGDGLLDWVWLDNTDEVEPEMHVRVLESTGTGFMAESAAPRQKFDMVKFWGVLDYNVDGYSDVLVIEDAQNWFIYTGSATGLSDIPITMGLGFESGIAPDIARSATLSDGNGDGLIDFYYSSTENDAAGNPERSNRVMYLQASGDGFADPVSVDIEDVIDEFDAVVDDGTLEGDVPEWFYYNDALKPGVRSGIDFNGDGRSDAIVTPTLRDCRALSPIQHGEAEFEPVPANCTNTQPLALLVAAGDPLLSPRYDVFEVIDPIGAYSLGDINGDGYTDIAYQTTPGGNSWAYKLNNGIEFDPTVPATQLGNFDADNASFIQLVDTNKDGALDFVYKEGTAIKRMLWNGDGFNSNPEPTSFATSVIDQENFREYFFDFSGDGTADYVRIKDQVLYSSLGYSPTQPANVITKITNGLGAAVDISYQPLTYSSVYKKHSSPPDADYLSGNAPIFDFIGSYYVVERTENSAPIAIDPAHTTAVTYKYEEARVQSGGRGFLGFEKVISTDEITGTQTKETYRQDFPFSGMMAKSEIFANGNLDLPMTKTEYLYTELPPEPGLFNPLIRSPVIQQMKETQRAANSVAGSSAISVGDELSVVTTDYVEYDAFGNVKKVNVVTEQIIDSTNNDSFTKETVNTYPGDTESQFLGRLAKTVVTHSSSVAGRNHADSVRTSEFQYDTTTGLLTDEWVENGVLAVVLEDGAPVTLTDENNAGVQLGMHTHYTYDQFGNVLTTANTAAGIAESRTTTSVYDARGRYVRSSFDALGNRVAHTADNERNILGLPTKSTDMNGVETTISYGLFGTAYYQASSLGGSSQTNIVACSSGCGFISTTSNADDSESQTTFDILGRKIEERTSSLADGVSSVVVMEYNLEGHLYKVSNPFFSGGQAAHYTLTDFDDLGRAFKVVAANGGVSTVDRQGYVTTSTNALGQKKQETRNVLGELVSVVDGLGNGSLDEVATINYEYDLYGNLIKTTAPGSNGSPTVVTTIAYDKLGRKVSMNDPDKGSWIYRYNPFGELEYQKDSNGNETDLDYDAVGRMESRVVTKSANLLENSSWTYKSNTEDGRTQLASETDAVTGFLRTFSYDASGRIEKVDTFIPVVNTTYSQETSYDQFNRVYETKDITGAILRSEYSRGIPTKISDPVLGKDFSQILEVDARGNVTRERLGNGYETERKFYPKTGLPESIVSTPNGISVSSCNGATACQNITFVYDVIGNLTERFDRSAEKEIKEKFDYDGMNRLTDAYSLDTASNQPSGNAFDMQLTYFNNGNIRSKSGVGDYTYKHDVNETVTVQPHAVKSIGSRNFSYDANGNMTSDTSGRELDYSSFDKPTRIESAAGHVTNFSYGPDRSRFMRSESIGGGLGLQRIVLYLGNVELIVEGNGDTETRRNIGGNVVVHEFGEADATTAYLFKDSLGSLDIILKEDGSPIESFSFDAFGKRRNTLTLGPLTATELQNPSPTAISLRGYSDHEMLDESGLIHMNGRVYDPEIARFVSADSVVPSVDYSQSFNRYSYVYNNPLRYTDPSGHFVVPLIVTQFISGAFLGAVGGFVGEATGMPWLSTIFSIAACAGGSIDSCGSIAVAVGFGFGGTLGGGGSFSDAVKAGALAGVTAGVFDKIGSKFDGGLGNLPEGGIGHVTAHAIAGGTFSVLRGGKFGPGFVSAGIVKGASVRGWTGGSAGDPGAAGRVVVASIIGGTVSEISGGKFANGAVTAAFQQAYNAEALAADHKRQQLANSCRPGMKCGPNWHKRGQSESVKSKGSPTLTGSLDAGGQVFGGVIGGSVSTGPTLDTTNLNACLVTTACLQIGVGVYGGVGITSGAGLSSEALKSGTAESIGLFGSIGAFGASAGGSINIGEGSAGGAKAFTGVGKGAAVGLQFCSASLSCTGK